MPDTQRQLSQPGAAIGCAGWALRSEQSEQFPGEGAHLERYAARFPAVEINSSFYRSHQPKTYARWAASVPEHFRFAVKIPRQITHEQRLRDASSKLDRFLNEVSHLGGKLGPLLVQLPPSLSFDAEIAHDFFAMMRERYAGPVACEPRHPSWFETHAEQVLTKFEIARVATDLASIPGAESPGGWSSFIYYRFHGSPRMYYSAYSPNFLALLAGTLRTYAARDVAVWCIFDNTAEGAATNNALELLHQL